MILNEHNNNDDDNTKHIHLLVCSRGDKIIIIFRTTTPIVLFIFIHNDKTICLIHILVKIYGSTS